jgi:hypothetical protein
MSDFRGCVQGKGQFECSLEACILNGAGPAGAKSVCGGNSWGILRHQTQQETTKVLTANDVLEFHRLFRATFVKRGIEASQRDCLSKLG